MDPKMEKCIQDCMGCYRICEETKKYSLEKGGDHADLEHLQALADCAKLCQTSAHMMITGSPLHPQVCGVCAEACDKCAEACERLADDSQLKNCAEICRECETSCREMAQMAA